MVSDPDRYRFSVAEYDQMIEKGIFPPEAQLDGYHSIQVVRPGDRLAPLAFPDLALDTAELLR